jgi:tetrahydromethanopterin S-methyltransferase subunit G
MASSFLKEPLDSAGTNQVLCANLSLLFTLLITRLMEAIARTGGKPLADQFAQQLNLHARQHGWCVLTGLSDLNELRRRIPDVDAKVLFSVYQAYARYAQKLARQILGEPLLKATLVSLLTNLPPDLVQINTQYRIVGAV